MASNQKSFTEEDARIFGEFAQRWREDRKLSIVDVCPTDWYARRVGPVSVTTWRSMEKGVVMSDETYTTVFKHIFGELIQYPGREGMLAVMGRATRVRDIEAELLFDELRRRMGTLR